MKPLVRGGQAHQARMFTCALCGNRSFEHPYSILDTGQLIHGSCALLYVLHRLTGAQVVR